MTYLECRQDGRTIWIGPFSNVLHARAWVRRHEIAHRLHCLELHESRVKVLFAAYEHHDTSRCVGVFEKTSDALAAAGKDGIVIHWRHADCLAPDDPPTLLSARPDPRIKLYATQHPAPEEGAGDVNR